MKYAIFAALILTGLLSACSNAPTYNSPLVTVDQKEVVSYWVFDSPIEKEDLKIISGPKSGCRVVYLEGYGPTSSSYFDIKYNIDSKGKQRDTELLATSEAVDPGLIQWGMKWGLSPKYEFVPSSINAERVPVESVKRLFLIKNDPLCKGRDTAGVALYSNQKITVTAR